MEFNRRNSLHKDKETRNRPAAKSASFVSNKYGKYRKRIFQKFAFMVLMHETSLIIYYYYFVVAALLLLLTDQIHSADTRGIPVIFCCVWIRRIDTVCCVHIYSTCGPAARIFQKSKVLSCRATNNPHTQTRTRSVLNGNRGERETHKKKKKKPIFNQTGIFRTRKWDMRRRINNV